MGGVSVLGVLGAAPGTRAQRLSASMPASRGRFNSPIWKGGFTSAGARLSTQGCCLGGPAGTAAMVFMPSPPFLHTRPDRESTRLDSRHLVISYALFCFEKKKRTAHVFVH